MFSRRYEDAADLKAAPSELFAFVDDHQRFSSHMNESSWMMGGAKMTTSLDTGKGQSRRFEGRLADGSLIGDGWKAVRK